MKNKTINLPDSNHKRPMIGLMWFINCHGECESNWKLNSMIRGKHINRIGSGWSFWVLLVVFEGNRIRLKTPLKRLASAIFMSHSGYRFHANMFFNLFIHLVRPETSPNWCESSKFDTSFVPFYTDYYSIKLYKLVYFNTSIMLRCI